MTIVTPGPAIDRDRYGRPLVTPPDGGNRVPYTRCTTFVDCIEDKFNLQKWQQRMVALGLAARPDLLLSVNAHRDNKNELDRINEQAREAAQASAAATTGTALHALTELVDRGQDLPPGLPTEVQTSLAAYGAATQELSAALIEQFCVLDTLKIGGTPDRVVEYQGQRYIADIKTGSIEWGTLKIASQLAVYARSYTYDITTGQRGHHDADTTRGIVIHLPAGTGECTLHWIDLEAGWYAVQVANQVREKRKLKFKDLVAPFGPVTVSNPQAPEPMTPGMPRNSALARDRAKVANQIEACTSRAEVEAVWERNAEVWNADLTARAKAHLGQLEAA